MGINYGNVIQQWAEKYNSEVGFAHEYGEPSYSNPEKVIVLANWNKIPERIAEGLEAQGYALEWYDEWHVNSYSSPCKAWRTSGDSYHWEPRCIYSEACGDMITADDDIELWIEQAVFESPDVGGIMPSWWSDADIEAAGWRLLDPSARDYEAGWHPGQTDHPSKFLPAILKAHGKALIQKTEQSQFYSKYRVWVPSDSEDSE